MTPEQYEDAGENAYHHWVFAHTVVWRCRMLPKPDAPKKTAPKRKRKIKIRFAELKVSRTEHFQSALTLQMSPSAARVYCLTVTAIPFATLLMAWGPMSLQERDALADVFCNFPERFAKHFRGKGHEVCGSIRCPYYHPTRNQAHFVLCLHVQLRTGARSRC